MSDTRPRKTWRQKLSRRLKSLRHLWRGGKVNTQAAFNFKKEIKNLKKTPVDASLPAGVNVLGWLEGEFGMCESSRAFARALQHSDIPFALNNIATGERNFGALNPSDFSTDNPYNLNLINISPNFMAHVFEQCGAPYFQERYNIGLWYWEMPEFPPAWNSCFNLCDEVWTPSHFCATVLARHSPVPVVKITYPLQLPDLDASATHTSSTRCSLGVVPDDFLFLFSFDIRSWVERKNPRAVVEAFRRANLGQNATLVLKTLHAQLFPEVVRELEEAARGLRVVFVHQHLMRNDVLALINACDCYVSLHRAEGLGLGMAEAMAMGKPVIATGYSGNLEFMNVGNSFLVRYDLVESDVEYGPYKRGHTWAQPDIEHAAQLMREVYENRETAQQIGRRAAHDIKTQFDAAKTGEEIRTRLKVLSKTRR